MKVGDLVTLSSRAQSLYSMAPWSPYKRQKQGKHPAVIGLVVEVKESDNFWDKGRELFYVKWVNHDGPPSREGRAGKNRKPKDKCFWRTDLKFVYKKTS